MAKVCRWDASMYGGVECGEPAEISFTSPTMPKDGELTFCPGHALGVLRGTRSPDPGSERFRHDEVVDLHGQVIHPPRFDS